MENHDSRIAHSHEASTDERASSLNPPAAAAALPDFEPVPLRYRGDGLTPAKQREFVEALADTGLIHVAAARVDVSPQAIARTRRRADAKPFDLACCAAQRFGARRLHALAYERAIEGTIKRHYYHGALKSEERVFDNRLLIYLLGKTEHLLDEPPEAAAVVANWEPWVEALETGAPPPDLRPAWQREQDERLAEDALDAEGEDEDDVPDDEEIWEDDGVWLTSFPPPADFDGVEDGVLGEEGYSRSLTETEEAAMAANDAEDDKEQAEAILRACARRDRYFGFAGGLDTATLPEDFFDEARQAGKGPFLFAREAETSETSARPDEDGEAPEEAEISSPLEAGLSEPSEPPVGVERAGPAAMAELYEPSWLCTGSAQQDHSTVSSDPARAPRDE